MSRDPVSQQDRLHDKHGAGTDPSRDASKQGASGAPKRYTQVPR